MTGWLEDRVFSHRVPILIVLALVTLWTGYHATGLRVETGYFKQLPSEHPYVETYRQYQNDLPGPNLVIVALRARDGEIWTPSFLQRLYAVTDDLFYLPGVYRGGLQSLWTPNTRVLEINEEGFVAYDVMPASITPDTIDEEEVAVALRNTIRGDYVGKLVSHDFTMASIRVPLNEIDPRTREELDYIDFAKRIETTIRDKYVDENFDIHIIGFAKLAGDIAEQAGEVVRFFVIAFLVTSLAVYIYARSLMLMALAVLSSLVSVVWQFGLVALIGYGLDPLAILVPFLVYAIGVSHAVQQINLIVAELSEGASAEAAARATFRRLLVPGSMALATDLIGFAALLVIPIGMITELAILASIGVALKIITNLIMLPILASYCRFDPGYAERMKEVRRTRLEWFARLGRIITPTSGPVIVGVSALVLVLAANAASNRHVGDLHAGAAELWDDSRYNRDFRRIVNNFSMNLDVLVVVAETKELACRDWDQMHYVNRYSWHMQNVTGVKLVASLPVVSKHNYRMWSEGSLKFRELARNPYTLALTINSVPTTTGLLDYDCSILPVFIFTTDHKATTIKRVIAETHDFVAANPSDDVTLRLAMGNAGLMAATNEEIEESEVPSLFYVFVAVLILVLVAYRDWRAAICCAMPLLLATFIGYWFMTAVEIGLKISTLPVLVLAVGFGVDDGFYLYSRIQVYLREGMSVLDAYRKALGETGMAVVFTSLVLGAGVATWAFSGLKFQADMGLLLAFMIMTNLVGAVTALPALAVTLDRLIPRRRTPAQAAHRAASASD